MSLISNLGVGALSLFHKKGMENEQKKTNITLFMLLYTKKNHICILCSKIQLNGGTYLIHLNYCLMSPSKLSDNRCSIHDIQS
jgi:uncharacterized protein YpmS